MNKDEDNSALEDDFLFDEGEEPKKASTEATTANKNPLFVLLQTMNDNMATMSEWDIPFFIRTPPMEGIFPTGPFSSEIRFRRVPFTSKVRFRRAPSTLELNSNRPVF